MDKRLIIPGIAVVIVAAILSYFLIGHQSKTRVLVVNPLPAQMAELTLNNNNEEIEITCVAMEDAHDFKDYDAILLYGRGLFLDSLQMQDIDRATKRGTIIYTHALRSSNCIINNNISSEECDTLAAYLGNPCKDNYVNLYKYIRHLTDKSHNRHESFNPPVELPSNLFYHLRSGKYFTTADDLTQHLKDEGLYHESGKNVAFISGITFPVEGNRAHVDTLILSLTKAGYNVYPLSAKGNVRARLIRQVKPDAIVYLPMGRLGNDSLINYCYQSGIPLFMPFPLTLTRQELLDVSKPISAGTLTARIVVPEIDGAMGQLCLSTQDPDDKGFLINRPIKERIEAFMSQFTRFMELKTKDNKDKKIAISYFKSPGKDALLASGMEVIPSMYNFLQRLKREGYDVTGLPASLEAFKNDVMTRGRIIGDYAPEAQRSFIDQCSPVMVSSAQYRQWASEVLLPRKYEEVERTYGKAPGTLLTRGDSIAVAAIRYGNILLFPQPRPALGDDDFKITHGVKTPPPHSYIAAYLYMQKGFEADALIHFGTHGNLEFTPGKNAAMTQGDWAEVLIGNLPHFYFYTTSNVGEAIIAKRRSHAVLVTHITPPFVESGMRRQFSSLLDAIHAAIADPRLNTPQLKQEVVSSGIHKDLGLDSVKSDIYSPEQLESLDSYLEELAFEKITGAYYTMGVKYSPTDIETTVMAMAAENIGYTLAKEDFDKGRITQQQLSDPTYLRHHYYPEASDNVKRALAGVSADFVGKELVNGYKELLIQSAGAEIESMVRALSGLPVSPAPGGDPVVNPNVLPTGRNMYSINAEATPGVKAYNDGVLLAEKTLDNYRKSHGEYPHKITFTFWAGEFITTQGTTIAQALRMLGIEPVRDEMGRVMDLRLIPSTELGRPRIDVVIQVSGQFRDIAASRLNMLNKAIEMAAAAEDDVYPNYVTDATLGQEKSLVKNGMSPAEARRLSTARIFGPVNDGYSSGILSYTENSGSWDDKAEIAAGFINNMCAIYGDTINWGKPNPEAFKAAVGNTDVIVQPRQSNTWGPVSLDHVYEYAGGLSLVATTLSGKEPDAVMADYRNINTPRIQDLKQAVSAEMRVSLLNPTFITERFKGDATTAQMFGEMFRNVFGWSVMRSSALNDDVYDRLYDTYIEDVNRLGIKEYFNRVNPAALQEMTSTMLEAARKGMWPASQQQLDNTARLHAELTQSHGAPCTEFTCGNKQLTQYIASRLDDEKRADYIKMIEKATSGENASKVMKMDKLSIIDTIDSNHDVSILAIVAILLIIMAIASVVIVKNRKK